MRIDIEVKYSEGDVEKIVLKEHVACFGQPPPGDEWVASGFYGAITVRNSKVKVAADLGEGSESIGPFPQETRG